MDAQPKRKKRRDLRALLLTFLLILLLTGIFFGYVSVYYPADETALAALRSDGAVTVTQTETGWFFDGPSETDALIFYPGGKVEETAYAPLLREIAEGQMDVFLLKVPFRLAVLAPDRAAEVMAAFAYENWYVGGHSLGGAIAADFAAKHGDGLRGLVLLAAYPTKTLDTSLPVLSLYGSEDGVLNREKLVSGAQFLPDNAVLQVIAGGNHAQFGSYGPQKGDGAALISPSEQWAETAALLEEVFGGYCLKRSLADKPCAAGPSMV